ncbi:VanW family protein [Microscilla marina]|uniref:VanW n=1 Tax=Microscilla marina ATCC 23134 TaxID=313606 RepID=A1ZJN2_MICM2|nr:VanW family protein [Microscilla marina]EAY29335.1 VanW [Microscilla marina ATCC 23134]
MTKSRKLLSQRHPWLYFISVWEKRLRRQLSWRIDGKRYTQQLQAEKLPFRVKKHQSKLLKKLGETDMQLQYNKVDNLKIVVSKINGMIIHPGETFSFCKTVGLPTRKKGYKEGMELSFGKPRAGVGGGICQSTNLLHWLALHSPLTITERHHHSIDPFPDNGRVLPWASGAAVFYNYIDFQLTNDTSWAFQINLWLTDKLLEGEIRVNEELDFAYHVKERNHRFIKKEGAYFRTNEIWRHKIAKFRSGALLEEELMYKNYGKVMYVPKTYQE